MIANSCDMARQKIVNDIFTNIFGQAFPNNSNMYLVFSRANGTMPGPTAKRAPIESVASVADNVVPLLAIRLDRITTGDIQKLMYAIPKTVAGSQPTGSDEIIVGSESFYVKESITGLESFFWNAIYSNPTFTPASLVSYNIVSVVWNVRTTLNQPANVDKIEDFTNIDFSSATLLVQSRQTTLQTLAAGVEVPTFPVLIRL